MRRLISAAIVLGSAAMVSSHGAVTIPPPRQAVDGKNAPWNGDVPDNIPFMFWCAKPHHPVYDKGTSPQSKGRNLTGSNGQACFWFNNGCDISCDSCDGSTGQVIHPRFNWTGTGPPPAFSDPTHQLVWDSSQGLEKVVSQRKDGSHRLSICANPKKKATICDPRLRTMNVDAPCHSELDFYQFAPWRAPGSAPVIDSCGVAGGVHKGEGPAAAGGDYQNTSNAKLGDFGKDLPPMPTGTVWQAGEVVEVAWTQKAYHGGGYQYRLCPADQALTEECFFKTPLPFDGHTSTLRWGGVGGEEQVFNATEVSVGTLPEGSTWRRGPIPATPWGALEHGPMFEPACEESVACRNQRTHPKDYPLHPEVEGAYPCKCSGWGIGDLNTLEIVDRLRIPAGLAPGDWVLGWRWDCEESTQVWNSCSDVTIKN